MANTRLILRKLQGAWSLFPDTTKGKILTSEELDGNQTYLKGEIIHTGTTSGTILTLNKINGNNLNIDLNALIESTDNYTTGGTLVGDVVYFDRSDQVSAYTVSLSALTSGGSSPWTASTGTNSVIIDGSTSVATGTTSMAQGTGNLAGGTDSTAIGNGNKALGNGSFASGINTIADGNFSHTEGIGTFAGTLSHAEGNGSFATASTSHAEGVNTKAFGTSSHSQGNGTTASGINSHAGGFGSIASGLTSFVHGDTNVAGGLNTAVIGGTGIIGLEDNTTYVPTLNIGTVSSATTTADTVVTLGVKADGTVVKSPSGSGYRVYTALISQTSTNAPTASVLENTLGGTIVWSRSGVGSYLATLSGAFPTSTKIFIMISNSVGPAQILTYNNDANSMGVDTYDNAEIASATDGLMFENSVEIRVYV